MEFVDHGNSGSAGSIRHPLNMVIEHMLKTGGKPLFPSSAFFPWLGYGRLTARHMPIKWAIVMSVTEKTLAEAPGKRKAAQFEKAAQKRLDPQARAELILEQALRLFSERHFSVVTVRDIAQACGIQNGLIYYYYENKEHLLRAALTRAIGLTKQTYLDPASSSGPPLQQLTAWLRAQVPLAAMLKQMNKVMADYSASIHRDKITDALIKDLFDGEQTLLETYLSRIAAAGISSRIDVTKLARHISLQIDGIFFSANSRDDDRIADDIESLCEMVESHLMR
ncbi:TetR/AcrR family transcriptional regulator [Acidisoma silvae]|uniref:TetR/AcrR family transcriptional regulator n=1 Tax=Acidisoma silvae TaxID=2802396 RepID=A0A963YXH9_9PROT|nr:TetR/AcrR family transcriptional regulator [Acidisoma silvae]MCB8877958.1 TetR/AcrR family transcriptional regulator [Acidisoma silvae]